MKAQELFRRLYRTLTSVVLFLILLNSWSPAFRDVYSRTFYYFNIGVCGVILTLSVAVYCFSMSRKQEGIKWKWCVGSIPILLLLLRLGGVKILIAIARNNHEFINIHILDYIFFAALMLYTAVITFFSKNQWNYKDVLQNQTETDTRIFKWLFVGAQIALWFCFILILPTFVNDWLSWWPTESWVNDAINSMNSEFEQYGL